MGKYWEKVTREEHRPFVGMTEALYWRCKNCGHLAEFTKFPPRKCPACG